MEETSDLVDKRIYKLQKTSKLLLSYFAILMVITYIYLVIRRGILITDASLITLGFSGFIDRSILLTDKDILANFTKVFDSLQVVAILGLLIAFILLLLSNKNNKNKKFLIGLIVNFALMFVIRLARVIIIHKIPGNLYLIGALDNPDSAYYDFAFFLYRTDSLRIVIVLLLIISAQFFIIYNQKMNDRKDKSLFTSSIILGITLFLYIIIIVFSSSYHYYFGSNASIIMYYVHYASQILLQLGNIFVYYSFSKREKIQLQ